VKINFIITCHNREKYFPYLKDIIYSYQTIEPNITLCYNGETEDLAYDLKIPNYGHQVGEYSLVKLGYVLSNIKQENHYFVKLSVDSWLLNEDVILETFKTMQEAKTPYGGSCWSNQIQLSTDIFFADTRYGNIFEELKFDDCLLEYCMYNAVRRLGKGHLTIKRRNSQSATDSIKCNSLNWVYSHDLDFNLMKMKEYFKDYPKIKFIEKEGKNKNLLEKLIQKLYHKRSS